MAEKQVKIEFTQEELDLIKKEQRRGFFSTQVPLVFGSTYATYILMKRGIWKKSGVEGAPAFLAYLPKCSMAFFASLSIGSVIVASNIGRKLMGIDGNYSRAVRYRQGIQSPQSPGSPLIPSTSGEDTDTSILDENRVLDSVLNPKTEELPPRQSLTYDDLRRKSRLETDGTPRQHPIPPRPSLPPSDSISLTKKPKDPAPGSNKYGDEWAET